ncbi:MAG: orotate phosphoribosyltransferase [Lachnospiraceae bacterium]|nr:orotate phosphoribosyltransferase [Lachnospiraceae bacterium]MCR4732701.1 orotate phosphoribosyltransferase [Lachnospiraceae bacterium]
MQERMTKFYSKDDRSVTINAVQGHFATSNSHINYYIDVTRLKVRAKEAENAAASLRAKLLHQVEDVDTIVCLDGTEVLGGFLAQELEKGSFHMTNKHDTMYIIRPEENSIHQFMFRQNNRLAIEGKNILILAATLTTGETMRRMMECVRYYGGRVSGVTSIFSTMREVDGQRIISLFTEDDLPGYAAYHPSECPFCAKKMPIEAVVNGYGYSTL